MMLRAKYFNLLAVTVFIIIVETKEPRCHKLLREVASTNSLFIQCVTNHAAPVSICEWCDVQYKNMQINYTAFREGFDTNATKCADIYIDKDRLNILAHTNEVLSKLWNEAFCEACYDSNAKISNETNDFRQLYGNFDGCQILSKEFCVECEGFYNELNDFYEHLIEVHKHKVCFDIQDLMNRTRSAWTKDCGHNQPGASLVAFLAVSCTLSSIPVLFYFGFFIYGRRLERNHQLLDLPAAQDNDNENIPHSDYLHSVPSTSSNIFTDGATPANKANPKLINEDESDEDLLL